MSTFSKTQSVASYASSKGLTSLEIKKNPKTGKYFGVDSEGNTYRIADSLNGVLTMDCQVSYFTPTDGDASWMIHPRGEGAPTVSSLSFAPKAVTRVEDAI